MREQRAASLRCAGSPNNSPTPDNRPSIGRGAANSRFLKAGVTRTELKQKLNPDENWQVTFDEMKQRDDGDVSLAWAFQTIVRTIFCHFF